MLDGWGRRCEGHGWACLHQRHAHRRHLCLHNTQPLRASCEGTGRGITKGAEHGLQHRQEDMNPLMGCALAHPEQASLHHLERMGLQGGQHKQQPVFGGWQGAVLIDGKPPSSPGFPGEAPRPHMCLERGLKRRDHELKLVERHTG